MFWHVLPFATYRRIITVIWPENFMKNMVRIYSKIYLKSSESHFSADKYNRDLYFTKLREAQRVYTLRYDYQEGAAVMAVGGLSTAQMMQEIQGRKKELYTKILKGETQQKFQIGAEEYSEKEWKRMLDKFDETQNEIREALEEEKEAQGKGKAREQSTSEKTKDMYEDIVGMMGGKIR